MLDIAVKCPRCESDAIYRYGRLKNGEKRYKCVACDRQFTRNSKPKPANNRPRCPKCGLSMHLYMKTDKAQRLRCSQYPDCKTYLKVPMED